MPADSRRLAIWWRLLLLDALRDGKRSVGELTQRTGLSQANTSKHLQVLHALQFVDRRKDGLHVYYCISDPSVFAICDLVCGRLKAEAEQRQSVLAGL